MKKNKVIASLVFLFLIKLVLAAPPDPTVEYRGFAFIDDVRVADGTEVAVWANGGTLKMNSVYTQFGNGYYDHLEIIWDDPATPADEGITKDDVTFEPIKFTVGGYFTTTPLYVTESSSSKGKIRVLDLYVNTSVDMSGPNITLVSPVNNSVETSSTVVFEYNVTDQSGIDNCTLYLNSAPYTNDTTVQLNTTQNFTVSLADNTYTWYVTCYDNSSVHNAGISETRTLTVNTTAPYYIVGIATDWPLVAGKPVGINFTVNTSAGAAVYNATVKVTEKNGYAAFALTQKTTSNVTNYVTAETHTNQNGFVRFTITPTGGADIIGYEDYVGNYSVVADVYVNDALINSTELNVTQRTLYSATGIVTIPNQGDYNNFRIRLFNIYNVITDWLY